MMLLKLGRFKDGWDACEWRWKTATFTPFSCPHPQWQGETIADKILLVHSEQGNGDAIQFARFLAPAKAYCNRLIVVCPEPLRLLFNSIPAVDEVRLPGDIPHDLFDYYCPILSLPKALNITLETLPARTPYLPIPQNLGAVKLENTGRARIGLVWAGSATHQQDHHRSCPLHDFLVLAEIDEVDKVDFYSLQIPLSARDRQQLEANHIKNLEPELVSYAHSASLVEQLDLIVTVDTSVAHLAGALDKPVWILLAQNSDWRWGIGGDSSPWYPSTKLFRQREPGDWQGVLNEVRTEMAKMIGDSGQ